MEYIVGPVIGLLLGMKFTDYSTKKRQADIAALEQRLETLETDTAKIDENFGKELANHYANCTSY